jgi:hypothetical protein
MALPAPAPLPLPARPLARASQRGFRAALGWALAALFVSGCRSQVLRLDPSGPDPWRARIGLAYGIETWPRVDSVQFTRREWRPTSEGPILVGERTWIHAPRERWTWLVLPGDLLGEPFLAWPLDHLPGEPGPQLDDAWSELRELFLDDAVWLFLPYALALDPDLRLADQGIVGAPPDGVVARRIDVRRAGDLEFESPEELAASGAPSAGAAAGTAADDVESLESLESARSLQAAGDSPARLRLYLADSHWIMTSEWGPRPVPAGSEASAQGAAAPPTASGGSMVHSEPYPAGGLAFPLTHVRPDGSWIEYTGVYVRLAP